MVQHVLDCGYEVVAGEERAKVLILLDEALGISAATVSRDWTLAQAWLFRAVKQVLESQVLESSAPREGDHA